jgi:phosphatidylglycerophosphatase C
LDAVRTEEAGPTATDAVAVFDLDGTLTRGDTYLAFLSHMLGKAPLRVRYCLGLPYKVAMFRLGRLSNDALKTAFLCAILKGATREEIEKRALPFAQKCAREMIKPAALKRIDWHRAKRHRLILASASVDLYVPLVAALLGFDEAVCTHVAWAEGRLTGELNGPNLRGVAKLRAVRELIARHSDKPIIFAYSDSYADLPLLAFADRGVAVDPDGMLLRAAPRSGLDTEFWRD